MKNLFTILVFCFALSAGAQTYENAAQKAAAQTNKQLAQELATYKKQLFLEVDQVMLPKNHQKKIITNNKNLPDLLREFYDAARFYRVDYGMELAKLEKVVLVDANLKFIGEVGKDGKEIHLNSALLKYPALLRVIFNRQMGKLYGLKPEEKQNHAIMGECWKIDARHEYYAENLAKRPHQKKRFFLRLAAEKPLKKHL